MWKRIIDAYKWKRLLAGCQLSPENLPVPLTAPSTDDFIIAGCPRTGTSLLAAALFRPPNIVTVMEPWDGLRMAPGELYPSLRKEIETTGSLSRGRLDLDALSTGRVRWMRDGERSFPIEVGPSYRLGVKWPTFWQYLNLLPETRFLITIRHPAEVISSFERVGGRLAMGLDYDVAFNRDINRVVAHGAPTAEVRRALLYEHVNRNILRHVNDDNVLVVRYERWFSDPDGLRQDISRFLDVEIADWGLEIVPPEPKTVDRSLVELIERHAPVAAELGYDL